jgi:hypothetical protein
MSLFMPDCCHGDPCGCWLTDEFAECNEICTGDTWTITWSNPGEPPWQDPYSFSCTFAAIALGIGVPPANDAVRVLTLRGGCIGVHTADLLTYEEGSGHWKYILNSNPFDSWHDPSCWCWFLIPGTCAEAETSWDDGMGGTTTIRLTRNPVT